MKRSVIIALVVTTVALAGFSGYWVGFERGVAVGGAAGAVGNGDVAVAELTLLDAGKPDKARVFLETEVDDGFVGWSELTSSAATRASLAFLGSRRESYQAPWRDNTSVHRLAKYRRAHQSPLPLPQALDDISAQCRGQIGCWDLQPFREREARVASMAAKYAR